MRLPFAELRTIGKRGQPLKRPLALSAITPEAAERERQNMLLDHPVCWECCGPADAGALLMVIKMAISGIPKGQLAWIAQDFRRER